MQKKSVRNYIEGIFFWLKAHPNTYMILNGFGIQLANVDACISLGNIGNDKFNASLNFFKGVSF